MNKFAAYLAHHIETAPVQELVELAEARERLIRQTEFDLKDKAVQSTTKKEH